MICSKSGHVFQQPCQGVFKCSPLCVLPAGPQKKPLANRPVNADDPTRPGPGPARTTAGELDRSHRPSNSPRSEPATNDPTPKARKEQTQTRPWGLGGLPCGLNRGAASKGVTLHEDEGSSGFQLAKSSPSRPEKLTGSLFALFAYLTSAGGKTTDAAP